MNLLLNTRYKRWAGLISVFLAGQGSVQILNLVSGFLLLRWLSVEAYAQYSVAFGFQTTIGILIELGFAGSIIALVGDRGADKQVVGTFVRSAKHFRSRLFAIVIPIAAIVFPAVVSQQKWNWTTQLLLFASIVSSLSFQGWVSYYSAPLLINQQLKQYYQSQVICSFGRIILCFFLQLLSVLTSWTTAWVNSAVIAFNGWSYRQAAKPFITEPSSSNTEFNSKMLRYLSPLFPSIVFAAFQGQIALLIITLFGETESVAEVAALGRLGQLFFILAAFNSVVIEPYFAKLAHQYFVRRYFQIVGTAILVATVLFGFAFFFPEPLLWILGAKYQHLRIEIRWIVATACVGYVDGVIWTIHSSRKWLYWWGTIANIVSVLATQIICVIFMDLSTTINVIYFSLATTIVVMLVHIANGIYGFIFGSPIEANTRDRSD